VSSRNSPVQIPSIQGGGEANNRRNMQKWTISVDRFKFDEVYAECHSVF
jgi:hypothetical protein